MAEPITLLVIGEIVLVVLVLIILIIASTKKPRKHSPKNVRDDVRKIKEQVMFGEEDEE